MSNRQAMIGLALVLLFCLSALLAPLIAPYDPNAMDIPARLSAPGWQHLAGTDQLGRDTLSRILYGGRIALLIATVGVTISLVLGLMLGMMAAFGPRWLDQLLLLLFDAIRSFPTIILGLAMVALTGPSLALVMAIVILTSIPQYARVTRTAALALRGTDFVMAERSLGASTLRIMLHHILPNIMGPLLILAAMDVPAVVALEAGLSFLGLGVRPPLASWGTLLNDGYLVIRDSPWMVLMAGLPLVLTTLGFTFFAEGLRDAFDPRMNKAR
nr:ABC transporter permease [Pseudomonas sp. GX19020]